MDDGAASGIQREGGEGAAGTERAVDEPRYPINSVDNALKLLLLFREHRTIRVAEVSEALGVVRSTAHRLLAMLQYRGFVKQDPETKAYSAGLTLMDIGLSVVRQMDVRRQVRPYLERLSQELGETVHLMVLDGASAIFLDSVESTRALRTSSRVGYRYPAHATACGKVLLAELTPARLAELYPEERLARSTSHSIASRSQLLRELSVVRDRGYGTNRAESEPDVTGVGVLLRNAFGESVAAIGISAPSARLSEADTPAVAASIARIAEEAAEHLA